MVDEQILEVCLFLLPRFGAVKVHNVRLISAFHAVGGAVPAVVQPGNALAEKIKEANEIIAFCSDKLTKADKEIEKLLSEKRESEE